MPPSHSGEILTAWKKLEALRYQSDGFELRVDSLDLPSLVAVAQYGLRVGFSTGEPFNKQMDECNEMPSKVLVGAENVGSCLQSLRKECFTEFSLKLAREGEGNGRKSKRAGNSKLPMSVPPEPLPEVESFENGNPEADSTLNTTGHFPGQNDRIDPMPEAWVRGAILIRSHSLCQGFPAVHFPVIEALVRLLEDNIIPVVPSRGITASPGALGPLVYVAAALDANPEFEVFIGQPGARVILPTDVALRQKDIEPIALRKTERNGFFSGAAFPVAMACLAQFKADNLVILAQVLAALEVEALLEKLDNSDPFLSALCADSGQLEVTRNIRRFLQGSSLGQNGPRHSRNGELTPRRYLLRTAAQWIGPCLEDLRISRQQLHAVLNFRFNGTLNKVSCGNLRHGDNDKAAVVISATDKIRLVLRVLGKIVSSQSSELLIADSNRGLPAGPITVKPARSSRSRGVQADTATSMAELDVLASSVSTHIRSSEISYQSAASLALFSARYTHEALDVLSLMMSTQIYSLCQALDFCAMNARFIAQLEPEIEELTASFFGLLIPNSILEDLIDSTWTETRRSISRAVTLGSLDHCVLVAQSAQHHGVAALLQAQRIAPLGISEQQLDGLSHVAAWTSSIAATTQFIFLKNQEEYVTTPDATPYLGEAGSQIYNFIRKDLLIPFQMDDIAWGNKGASSYVNTIYAALRNGTLMVPVIASLQEIMRKEQRSSSHYYMKPRKT